jgi:acyl-CoA thioester hydrolase
MTAEASAGFLNQRASYPLFISVATRRSDFDELGQFSAAACCSLFDSAIHEFLLLGVGPEILSGVVASHPLETFCRFHRPIAFPQALDVGLRLSELGQASVRYDIALFRQGEEKPAATGGVVHVFVDREKGKPAHIPTGFRLVLERLLPAGGKGKISDPTRRCG